MRITERSTTVTDNEQQPRGKQLNETWESALKRNMYHLRDNILRSEFAVAPYRLDLILELLDDADSCATEVLAALAASEARAAGALDALRRIASGEEWANPQEAAQRFLDGLTDSP